MLPRTWMEAYINFLLRFRWPVMIVAVVRPAGSAPAPPTHRFTTLIDIWPCPARGVICPPPRVNLVRSK